MGNKDSQPKKSATLIITKYSTESSISCWSTPGFASRLRKLSYMNEFKIKDKLEGQFQIQNSSGETIFLARCSARGEDSFDLDDLDGKRVLSVRMAGNDSSDLYIDESRLAPGMLVGKIDYEKDMSKHSVKFTIVSASGERLVTRRSGRTYKMIREDDESVFSGAFKRTSRKGVKGHFSKNLDVLLKAAILSAAVVIHSTQNNDVN